MTLPHSYIVDLDNMALSRKWRKRDSFVLVSSICFSLSSAVFAAKGIESSFEFLSNGMLDSHWYNIAECSWFCTVSRDDCC